MKLTMKKTLAFLLALTMLLSCGSFHVFADASEDSIGSIGEPGSLTTWTIVANGYTVDVNDGKVYKGNDYIATLPRGQKVAYKDEFAESPYGLIYCDDTGVAEDGYTFLYSTHQYDDYDYGSELRFDNGGYRYTSKEAGVNALYYKLRDNASRAVIVQGLFQITIVHKIVLNDQYYVGEEINPNVTHLYGTEGTDYSVTYEYATTEDGETADSEFNLGKPSTPGTYIVKATVETSYNYPYHYKESVTRSFTITEKEPATVVDLAANDLTYNGEAQALVTPGTVTGGTLKYSLTGAGDYSETIPTGKDAKTYTVWYKVFGDENHSDSEEQPITVEINPKSVNVTGLTAEKVYDGDAEATVNADNAVFTDKVGDDDLTISGKVTFTDANAGESKEIDSHALTLGGNSASNYTLGTVTVAGKITQKVVGLEWSDTPLTYNGNPQAPTATVNNKVGHDEVTVTVSGAQTNANTTETPSYTATATGLTGAAAGNYKLPENGKSCRFTIGNASINGVNAKDFNGTYDGNPHSITVEVTDPADTTITYSTTQNGDYRTDNPTYTDVGRYEVYYKVAKANYGTVSGSSTVNITPAKVTVSADTKSMTYGETDPALTATVTGLVGSDSVEYTLSRETGENVGNYAITPAGDATQGNYTVTYVPANLTITKATATVTAADKSKTYGDADPALTATVTGLVGSDSVEYTLSRETGENVGPYAITPAGAAEQGNYDVTYVPAILTINKATATVTADAKQKTYGDADPEFTATVTGLKNGDAESVISYTLSREEGENVGPYAITPAGAAEQGNYDVSYVPANLTITKATATVTAADKSKTYGDADPELTATVTGLKNNDAASVISYNLSRAEGQDVGTYAITPTGETEQGNYTVTYGPANLTITRATATVTADTKQKNYGDADPELTATVIGLKNDDTASVINYTVNRAAGTNVGTYTITPSGETEQGNYNVTFVNGTFTIIPIGATYTVPAAITGLVYDGDSHKLVSEGTVTGGTIQYKLGENGTYGNSIPTGTEAGDYTVYYKITVDSNHNNSTENSISVNIAQREAYLFWNPVEFSYDGQSHVPAASVNNKVNGDEVIVTVTGAQTEVGTNYEAEATELTGAKAANYKLPSSKTTAFAITAAAMTVSVSGFEGAYDGNSHSITVNSPAGTTVTYSESETGTFSDVNPVYTNVGEHTVYYKVEKANYVSETGSATVKITPRSATVKANDASKVIGHEDPEFTATVTGLVGNDTLSYTVSCDHDVTVGNYEIIASGAATQRNYNVTYEKGTFSILAVEAPKARNRSYTGSAQALLENPESSLTWEFSTDNINWSTAIPTGINAGDYNVYWKVHNDNRTIDLTDGGHPVKATIAKAEITPVVSILNWRTDRTPSEPTVIGNTGNGAVTYAYKVRSAQDTAYSAARPGAVGDYTIRATIAETQNYLGATVTSDFSISAAPSGGITGGNGGSSTVTRIGQNEAPSATETVNIVDDSVPLAGGIIFVVKVLDESTGYRGSAAQDSNGIIRITITDANGIPTAYTGPVLLTAIGPMTGDVVVEIDPATGDTVDLIEKSCVEADAAYALTHGGAALKIINNAGVFTDVMPFDWFYDAARFVSAHELFKGYADGSFQPNANTTRAMLVTVLHRLENRPSSDIGNLFPDLLNDQYYSEGMKWGTEQKIIMGYEDGLCRPDQNVSRQEMAVILYRYKRYLGYDVSARADLSAFADAEDIGDWALEAMQWAVASGIISGRTDDLLDPAGFATRAEVATMIMRIVEDMVK